MEIKLYTIFLSLNMSGLYNISYIMCYNVYISSRIFYGILFCDFKNLLDFSNAFSMLTLHTFNKQPC